MKLSIIIINYYVENQLIDCIKSILQNTKINSYEILIVNNGSKIKFDDEFRKLSKKIRIISPSKNLGFGRGCNLGAKKANGKYLLFLNPDTKVYPNFADKMVKFYEENPDTGVMGPKIVDNNNKILPSISRKITRLSNMIVFSPINSFFRNNRISKNYHYDFLDRSKIQVVDVVSGACMMVSNKIFTKVKGFDEKMFMYFEEHELCLKVQNLGFKNIFYPKAKIYHAVGQSLTDKKEIKNYFQKSRYYYAKKHFGKIYALFSEIFIRSLNFDILLVFLFFSISFWINTYKLDELMIFIGDMARDYLVAKDWVVNGQIPIVGIPSSVTWLSQGPISVWLVSLSWFLTNFNPTSPAVLFGFLGGITTGLLYILSRNYFSRLTAVITSILYLSAPIVVINARMPYHTSLVPFFTVLFFLLLPTVVLKKKLYMLLGFLMGLLLLVELSNIVVFGIIFLSLLIKRYKPKVREIAKFSIGLILGTLPFIVHDLLNGPTYLKFPLWIVYRLFKSASGNLESENKLVSSFSETLIQQITGSIMPSNLNLTILIFVISVICLVFFAFKFKRIYEQILLLWIFVPGVAFLFHNAPGTAYFSLLYPAIILTVGYFLGKLNIYYLGLIAAILIAFLNFNLLLSNDFFVNTYKSDNLLPPTNYSFGNTYKVTEDTARFIVNDSHGKKINLKGYGIYTLYPTSLNPYKFFIWKLGGKEENDGNVYIISDNASHIPGTKVVYRNRFEKVSKYE